VWNKTLLNVAYVILMGLSKDQKKKYLSKLLFLFLILKIGMIGCYVQKNLRSKN
jgi:hypothetical protein